MFLQYIISLRLAGTFHRGIGWRPFHPQVPGGIPLIGKVSHFKIADGEADDGGLVELAGDGAWERQELRQLVELKVLLSTTRAGGISRLLFSQCLQPETGVRRKYALSSYHIGSQFKAGYRHIGWAVMESGLAAFFCHTCSVEKNKIPFSSAVNPEHVLNSPQI